MSLTFRLKCGLSRPPWLRWQRCREKLGSGGKLKVTFSNEFAAPALTLEKHPLFFSPSLPPVCVPPSDLSVSSILLGLGSLPNQRWYYQGHCKPITHTHTLNSTSVDRNAYPSAHTHSYTSTHKFAGKSSKLNKKAFEQICWLVRSSCQGGSFQEQSRI